MMDFRETDADILEEIDLKKVTIENSNSWERDDDEQDASRHFNASECPALPFPPETIVQPFFSPKRSEKIIARVVRNESDLVMDFAFLLCGWESRSMKISNGKCSLRYKWVFSLQFISKIFYSIFRG